MFTKLFTLRTPKTISIPSPKHHFEQLSRGELGKEIYLQHVTFYPEPFVTDFLDKVLESDGETVTITSEQESIALQVLYAMFNCHLNILGEERVELPDNVTFEEDVSFFQKVKNFFNKTLNKFK